MIGEHDDLKALVRTISDFPKPGIQFRDITTLLLDAIGFAAAIDWVRQTGRGALLYTLCPRGGKAVCCIEP